MDDYALLFHKKSTSIFLSASLLISLFATIKFFWSITPLRFCQFCLSICLLLLYFYHATIVSHHFMYSYHATFVFLSSHATLCISIIQYRWFCLSICLLLFIQQTKKKKKQKKRLIFQLIYGLETKYMYTILGTQHHFFCFKIV